LLKRLCTLATTIAKPFCCDFFEEQDFGEVGAALNVSEGAARMRVTRAEDIVLSILTRRGVALPSAGLSAAHLHKPGNKLLPRWPCHSLTDPEVAWRRVRAEACWVFQPVWSSRASLLRFHLAGCRGLSAG
jgi:hypothetical protein